MGTGVRENLINYAKCIMVWEPSNGFKVKISSFLKKVCKLKATMKIKCFRISEIHRGLKGISLVRCSFQLPPDQLLHPNWFQSKHLQSEECLPGSAVYGNKWKAGQKAGDAKVWWALQADLASAAGPRDAHNARSLVEPWLFNWDSLYDAMESCGRTWNIVLHQELRLVDPRSTRSLP